MTANRPAINPKKYAKLLAKTLPSVIETEEEYERMLAQVEPMFDKGEDFTPEEGVLFDLLVHLIQEYEEKHYQLNAATPRAVLVEIMESRNTSQADIAKVIGSRSRASEIISGKRDISREQAKLLAGYFNVSVELFI
jgi:HTH-type transcriptional regulator / antitoxin HigA